MRRIEILDESDRVRIAIGELAPDIIGLRVLDTRQQTRVWIALEATGPVVALGRDGNVLAEVGVQDAAPELRRSGAYAFLAGPDGMPLRGIWLDDGDREEGSGDTSHDL